MRRLAWLGRESSRRAGQTRGGPRRGRLRGAVTGGLAAAVAVVGLVAFATPAFAQDNVITATASCASPLGSGAQITWTIANGFNLAETGTVTTVTGGLSTLDAPAFSIAASPGQPSQTATLTQTLPAGTTGVITLDVSSTWSNGASETGSGTFDLSMIGCAAPVQSIAGHIYLCHGGNPTTDEETGGMLGADGTGLSTVPPTLNPLAPADVIAGSYSMTASSPPGFQLVACGGSSSPNAAGTSATESVDVPSGGAGVGVFYAAPSSPPASVPAGTATNSVTPATAGGSVTPTITATDPGTPTTATGSLTPATPTGSSDWTASGKPSISLEKTASIKSYSAPGTLVTYSYKVTNTGNVTLDPVTVTDPMVGLSPISCPATSLAPWVSETCTATYTTTQADVDRGSLENTGTATGTPPSGPPVTAQSSVCIPACQYPSIALKKTASIKSYSAPGTLVTYSYKVTNTGNVTLDPVTVTDPMVGLSPISCPATSLAPWVSETCTATYTTTQADVDRGSLENTGTATGTPPSGPPVTAQSSVCIPACRYPSIALKKTASIKSYSAPGTLVTYSYKVTNTGNVTLDPVTVTDPMAGLSPISCPATSLAPWVSETCTATYTTTQADVDRGSLENTGTATGTPPSGPPVTAQSSVCIPACRYPSIALKKTASIKSYSAPGTLVTYSYKVTNTGNVTLDPVTVTDPMVGLSPISCPATSLAPWVSETCTATYTTTQADVDRGSLENTGTATGTPPSGPPVTAQSSVCIPAVQTPSISVVKSADVPTVSAVGQVVTYTFTIANTGNVTLYDVDVTDAQASPSLASSLGPITCATGTDGSITLAPAATDTCSATYTVTQADLSNNSIEDTATVTGQPPNQLPPVTDTSTLTLTVTSVSVVKAASPAGGVVAGSATPIVYTLTVTNTGSATTTAPIVVTDAAPTGTTLVAGSPACAKGGPPNCTVTVTNGTITWTIPAGVAPGASYTLTYLVTADATDATGTITNTASWSGPGCVPPVAESGTTTCPTNTVTTPVTAAPVTTSMVSTIAPPTTSAPAAPAPTTPPAAAPALPLAFTGAPLTQEWMFGVAELLIGAALLIAARWRRRSPRGATRQV